MRDLEIRGAGSLLGQFQSGHINSIGFELYCQLLRATVANLKGDVARLPVQIDLYVDFITFGESDDTKLFVGFSKDYITSEKLRLEMYRRLMLCVSQKDLSSFKAELKDSVGKLPISANNMLIFQEIRLLVADLEFYSLSVENEILIFKGAGKVKLKDVERYLFLKGRSLQKKFSNILLNVKSIIKSISD
jgi:transcription-repair coupling factor (superfamily II helicase)